MRLHFSSDGETATNLWRAGVTAEVPDSVARQFIAAGIATFASEPEMAIEPPGERAVLRKGKARGSTVSRKTARLADQDD